MKGACGAVNGVKGIIVLAKSVVTYIKHSAPVQHCLHQLQKDSGVRKPRKVKQEMPVRWDTEFDMVSSVLRLKQFLMELFTLPIYVGPTITVRQTGGELASKGIFLIQQLCRDIDALSLQGMSTFKNESSHRLHEEMGCFLKFYPYVMACYLNINLKGVL